MKLLHSYRYEIILKRYTYQCLPLFFKVFIGRAYKIENFRLFSISIFSIYLSLITLQYNQLPRKSKFTNSIYTNLSIYNIIIAYPQLKSKQFSQFLYLVLNNSSSIFSCISSISGKIKRIPRLYIANTSLKLIVSSRANFLCIVIGLFSIVCT